MSSRSIHRISLRIALLLLWCSCQAASAEPAKELLPEGYGYLIINLNVGGVAPSLDITRLDRGMRRKYSVPVVDVANGFHKIELPAGNYQVVQINAPYFDLPYKLDTSEDLRWRFTVKADQINYLGKLIIGKERTAKTVDVRLLNHVAKDLPNLQREFSEILMQYPLRAAAGYRDDFLQEYYQKQE